MNRHEDGGREQRKAAQRLVVQRRHTQLLLGIIVGLLVAIAAVAAFRFAPFG